MVSMPAPLGAGEGSLEVWLWAVVGRGRSQRRAGAARGGLRARGVGQGAPPKALLRRGAVTWLSAWSSLQIPGILGSASVSSSPCGAPATPCMDSLDASVRSHELLGWAAASTSCEQDAARHTPDGCRSRRRTGQEPREPGQAPSHPAGSSRPHQHPAPFCGAQRSPQGSPFMGRWWTRTPQPTRRSARPRHRSGPVAVVAGPPPRGPAAGTEEE